MSQALSLQISFFYLFEIPRAVARFFVTGGGDIVASAEGMSLLGGGGGLWGYSSPESFKILRLWNAFLALFMRYASEKSTLDMKMADNCKSL